MATIINTKLGENRGRKRVYIEGEKLAREGYTAGTKFNLELKDSKILLRANDEGRYTVSKRTRNGVITPILDLTSKEIAEAFEGVTMLRVAVSRGKIVISAHKQHQLVKERVERLYEKLSKGEELAVFSAYHGGGVLDAATHHGLAGQGVKSKIAVAVEIEGKYIDSSLRNNPELWNDDSIVIESAIQDIMLDRNPEPVDIFIAGIPCQGASLAGRSAGNLAFAESHSNAGSLFFSTLELIKLLNPSAVILENVAAYTKTASMEVIRSVLASLGYDVQERILEGNEFGALENRKRLCVVALTKGVECFELDDVMPTRTKEAAINDILEDLPSDSPRWKAFEYAVAKDKRDKEAGKGFARQLLKGDESYCGVVGAGYAKCRSSEPYMIHPENDDLTRIFTPLEHARLKAVPEHIVDGLSDTVAHQILGQSIIYPAFFAVAHKLGESLMAWTRKMFSAMQSKAAALKLAA